MDEFITSGFQARKAAQVAAFFVNKAGNSIEKVRLMKLIYLSERNFIENYSEPMLYDELYSLEQGPVCITTLSLVNGQVALGEDYVRLSCPTEERMLVRSDKTYLTEELDELSRAELKTLESVWVSFGHLSEKDIVAWTHKHCPEYIETEKNKKNPISYEDLYKAMKFEDAKEMAKRISDYRRLSTLLPA